MTRISLLFGLTLLLSACAAEVVEEAAIIEPVVEEPILRTPAAICDEESDDGIGGTGCSAD